VKWGLITAALWKTRQHKEKIVVKKKTYRPVHNPAKSRPSDTNAKPAVTFAGMVKSLVPKPVKPVAKINLQSAPFAHLPYEEELEAKNNALDRFWKHFRLPGKPEPVTGSPRPRNYRTTSKRRTVYRGSTLYLLFGDTTLADQKIPFAESPLELREHSRIYGFLQNKISEPVFKLVAGHLNYLIIRGSYTEQAVIFNVDTMNGPLVRKLKILADHLRNLDTGITAAYIYPDPSGSDYYLEERQPADLLHFKKLFGKGHLSVTHKPCRFSFHPTSFSQVNESMVPVMLDMIYKLLAPAAGEDLLDLYCGYGLFSHYLAPGYKKVLGIDAEGPSIRSAMHNKKMNPGSNKTRFMARRITEETVEQLQLPINPESILLDPPRKGPAEGVIAALCKRHPKKVLHIHCGVDQIPDAISQWQKGGYKVRRIVPLDMFPGSANLEVLTLLT
jgi:tRNA/tmRNA/rRNA uracil-C5-methylase (TrmA/RlmC/RlmD family)